MRDFLEVLFAVFITENMFIPTKKNKDSEITDSKTENIEIKKNS